MTSFGASGDENSISSAHASVLLGASLLAVVLVCVLPVYVLDDVRPELRLLYLVVAAVAGLTGATSLIPHREAHPQLYALVALLLIDVLPLVMASMARPEVPTRPWASLFLIPVLLTASSDSALHFRVQLTLGIVLGFVLLSAGAPSLLEAILSCAGFLFFMIVCATLTRQDWAALHERFRQLSQRSETDEMTGLLNRRGFVRRFPEIQRDAQTRGVVVGTIMIDIDRFSQINSAFGYAYGDLVLRKVCVSVQREADSRAGLVARIGGEELVVVVAGDAAPAAEALRSAIARAEIHPGLTVSMGICDSDPGAATSAEQLWRLVDLTDAAMYRAKEAGRDRIERVPENALRSVRPPPLPDPNLPLPAGVGIESQLRHRAPDPMDENSNFRLFACFVAFFAALGSLAYRNGVAIDPHSTWASPFLVTLLGAGLLGLGLALYRSAAPPVLVTATILALELATMAGVLATPLLEHRMLEVCLLAVPALVAAHSMSRSWVVLHVGLVFAGTGMAVRESSGTVDAAWLYRTLSLAVVLSAAPAVLFWLRERRAEANARLRFLSALDPLTSVTNRSGLERVVASGAPSARYHVLAVNIDGFKRLNDSYGHVFGDHTLILLAANLVTAVREAKRFGRDKAAGLDTARVARTGGDRFVVLTAAPGDPELLRSVRRSAAPASLDVSLSFGEAEGTAATPADLWALVALAEADLLRSKSMR
jgi:diguanylate cyclase (GGDEF)-like protein